MDSTTINIISHGEGVAGIASNFAETPFVLDGIRCGSVEGVVQALKEEDPRVAARIARHSGKEAKRAGTKERNRRVREAGTVWWKGRPLPFRGEEHFALINAAIREKFRQNEEARHALISSGDCRFTHDTGRPEKPGTSYPAAVFIAALYAVREELQQDMADAESANV